MRLPMEYDAMFRMRPKDLANCFEELGLMKSANVRISITNQKGVDFTTEEADPNLDRGDDSPSHVDEDKEIFDSFTVNPMEYFVPPVNPTIEIEGSVRETGIKESFCMMCLQKYINEMTRKYPEATDVTLYVGRNTSAFMIYIVPPKSSKIPMVEGLKVYIPPEANHAYHTKREREAVRKNLPLQVGDGNEVNAEDGERQLAKENEKEKLNPEGGDGKGAAEMVPKDVAGDGKGDDELIPNVGDDAAPK